MSTAAVTASATLTAAAAPAAAAPPTTPPVEPPSPSPQGATPEPSGKWYEQFEDADLRGYIENKAWQTPKELAEGYRNLEKLLGANRLPMPKDEADKEGWERVYNNLGRPNKADDYKLPVPEGSDPAFAQGAQAMFHELGLNTRQAQALAEWFNGESQQAAAAQAQAQEARAAQELGGVKSEWGAAWEENVALGQRAVREFGLAPHLDKLESAIGAAELMKLAARIGRGLTEHTFESGKDTQGFGMTPTAAQARITALKSDREFIAKYLGGDAAAKGEMDRLHRLAFAE